MFSISFRYLLGNTPFRSSWWRHQMETFPLRVTGPLCGEFTGHQWRAALMFPLICAWRNGWANNRKAGDLRRHHAHYAVRIMLAIEVWAHPSPAVPHAECRKHATIWRCHMSFLVSQCTGNPPDCSVIWSLGVLSALGPGDRVNGINLSGAAYPDNKVHGANMGLSGAGRTQVGPMLPHELCHLGSFAKCSNPLQWFKYWTSYCKMNSHLLATELWMWYIYRERERDESDEWAMRESERGRKRARRSETDTHIQTDRPTGRQRKCKK